MTPFRGLLVISIVAAVPLAGANLACNCSDFSQDLACRTSVSTLAGSVQGYLDGGAQSAQFNSPGGIAVLPDKTSAIVTDYGNNVVRRIDLASGQVSTVAGSGTEKLS